MQNHINIDEEDPEYGNFAIGPLFSESNETTEEYVPESYAAQSTGIAYDIVVPTTIFGLIFVGVVSVLNKKEQY